MTKKRNLLIKVLLLSMVLFVFGACKNSLNDNDIDIESKKTYTITGNVNIDDKIFDEIDNYFANITTRTGLPSIPEKSTLEFSVYATNLENRTIEGEINNEKTKYTIILPEGTWTITIIAQKDGKILFEGNSNPLVINGNAVNSPSITLKPTQNGTGSIELLIEKEESISCTKIEVILTGSESNISDFYFDENTVKILFDNILSGTYNIKFNFYDGDTELIFTHFDSVNIYDGLTTNFWSGNNYLFEDGEYKFLLTQQKINFFKKTTFYVNNSTGNDENIGSFKLPFATIQNAINVIDDEVSEYTIFINGDFTLIEPLTISKSVKITKYGETAKIIRSPDFRNDSLIKVETGATLTISDIVIDGEDTELESDVNGGGIYVNQDGTLNLKHGAIIQNCMLSSNSGGDLGGGGVYLSGGKFTMSGGAEISNCTGWCGGGVQVGNGSTFTMTGGTIKECNAGHSGGGVWVAQGSSFELSGGTIESCSAQSEGGGVHVTDTDNPCIFTMTGDATIRGCSAINGGGVSYGCGTTNALNQCFSMEGGTISNCSSSDGGGVYLYGNFIMTGGTISENSTNYGGAVYIRNDNSTFMMTGGTILENTATVNGGGVYLSHYTSKFEISSNAVVDSTNDVHLTYDTMITIGENLSADKVATITPSQYEDGIQVLTVKTDSEGKPLVDLTDEIISKFSLTQPDDESNFEITQEGTLRDNSLAINIPTVIASLTEGHHDLIVKGECSDETYDEIILALNDNPNISVSLDLSRTTGLTDVSQKNSSFENKNLTKLILPNNLEEIGEYAFYQCTALVDVYIPKNIIHIEGNAFGKSNNIIFHVDSENPIFSTSEDGVILYKTQVDVFELFAAPSVSGDVIIPEGVTSIGMCAFENCTSLTSVYIPSTVTNIGDFAFGSCSSIQTIEIPDSVRSIGRWAFLYCTNLQNIDIQNGISTIESDTFYGCSNLQTINIPKSVKSIGDYAFFECSSLQTIYYGGTEDEWNNIEKAGVFDEFPNLEIIFAEPTYATGITYAGEYEATDYLFYIYDADGLGTFRDIVNGTLKSSITIPVEVGINESDFIITDFSPITNISAVLMNDINLVYEEWTPIGKYTNDSNAVLYSGIFDGNGKTITFGTDTSPIEISEQYAGLFANVSGTIKQLVVQGSISHSSSSPLNSGGIIAVLNGGTIENCINKVTYSNSSMSGTGGIVGYVQANGGTIQNCINFGNIGSSNSIGGILGSSYNSANVIIQRCINIGTISGNTNISGILGSASSQNITISDCMNLGEISANNTSGPAYASGITTPSAAYFVSSCINVGKVSAEGTSSSIMGGITSVTSYNTNFAKNYYNLTINSNVTDSNTNGVSGKTTAELCSLIVSDLSDNWLFEAGRYPLPDIGSSIPGGEDGDIWKNVIFAATPTDISGGTPNYTVYTDYATLKNAVGAISSGDSGVFYVQGEIESTSTTITVKGDVTIIATSEGATISRKSTFTDDAIFSVNNGASLKLGEDTSGSLIIDGGSKNDVAATYPLIHSLGSLEIAKNCTLQNNNNTGDSKKGGAIYEYCTSGTVPTFKMSGGVIKNCQSSSGGGGIYILGGSNCKINLEFSGGEIVNNYASNNGGGIYLKYTNGEISGTKIYNNYAKVSSIGNTSGGGGIYSSNSTITINSGEITNNTTNSYGGGIYVGSNTTITILGGDIKDNATNPSTTDSLNIFNYTGTVKAKEDESSTEATKEITGDSQYNIINGVLTTEVSNFEYEDK